MKKYVIGLGIVSFLVAAIGGMMSGNLGGFLLGILSATISSGIFFGIAAVLDGQESILSELSHLHNYKNSVSNKASTNVVCKKCDNEYDIEYTSCPYCGNRP